MDYLVLLSSIGLGAITVLGFHLDDARFVKVLNAFTGAYLLTLTLLHLLPDVYQAHGGAAVDDHLRIGALMLIGFLVQVALDVISMGVEHGHAHPLSGRLPWGVLVGLCLHALVEATALGHRETHPDPASRQLLLWSIVLHNYPVSIALLGMLLQGGMKRGMALGLLGVFGAMAPCGMFISAHTGLAHYSRELMALVIGIFLHISTTILWESSDVHRFNFRKLAAILFGLGLGVLSVLKH